MNNGCALLQCIDGMLITRQLCRVSDRWRVFFFEHPVWNAADPVTGLVGAWDQVLMPVRDEREGEMSV